jgi:DNA-binding CsgD family transcriptional regulator/PAS domain-containing protein
MPLSHQRFSDLIGAVYDCAIDPELWPAAIEKICRELRCVCGSVMLVDLQSPKISYAKSWNFDLVSVGGPSNAFAQYFQQLMGFLLTRPLDEPYAGSRIDFSPLASGNAPIHLNHQPKRHPLAEAQIVDPSPNDWVDSMIEWVRKSGHYDSLITIVLRGRSRIGLFCVVRDQAGGFATDDDLAMLGMLAPHIRRAITISDLLNLKTVEAEALSATLDKLTLGVIIVAADRRILHANEAAKRMLAAASPVRSTQGRLHVAGVADGELAKAIAFAEHEVDIGKVGISIALQTSSGEPAAAHVLPLACGDVRSRLLPQAAAAIFLTRPGEASPADLSGFAEIYKLTPAETRVLQQLVRGGTTMLEVATALSVSETTAKTHLSHILAKTGVSRQTDLIALVRDLVPPVNSGRS